MFAELAHECGAGKHDHFYPIYDHHLLPLKETAKVVVEIGVAGGGSLRMWEAFFPNAEIYGIDNNWKTQGNQGGRIHVSIGDQKDVQFLESFAKDLPPIDLLVDDGGHYMVEQITSLKTLWPHVAENGLYVIEDLHTSYNGAYTKGEPELTTDFLKQLVDSVMVPLAHNPMEGPLENVGQIHFYPSLCVLVKQSFTDEQSVVCYPGIEIVTPCPRVT